METAWKILVADRNRHVRDFLRRELAGEGYTVMVAGDGREVRELLKSSPPPDLVILDPEIPFVEVLTGPGPAQTEPLRIPLILHIFGEDQSPGTPLLPGAVAFLEKTADPARLKQVVAEVLRKGKTGRSEDTGRNRQSPMSRV